jgi:hypothetical protein
MYEKTLILTACLYLCFSVLGGQTLALNNPPVNLQSAAEGAYVERRPAPPVAPPYLEAKGTVKGKVSGRIPEYFHLDVYRMEKDGEKTLMRTSRFLEGKFKTYLTSGFDHLLVFNAEDFSQFEVVVSAEVIKDWGNDLVLQILLPEEAPPAEEVAEIEQPAKDEEWVSVEQKASSDKLAETPSEASTKEITAEISDTEKKPLPEEKPIEKIKVTEKVEAPEELSSSVVQDDAANQQPRAEAAFRNTKKVDYFAPQESVVPLFAEFGGKGEVLKEIKGGKKFRVLEYTTPEWWLVTYRDEVGWVNAQEAVAKKVALHP